MFSILIIIFSLLLGVIGIVLFILQFQESRRIFLGQETSKRILIKAAIMNGLAVNLGFLALELFLAGLDKNHVWSTESVLVMIAIPIFGNVVVTLGSLWRFYIVGKYRGFLYRKLSENFNDDETKVKK